MVCHVMMIGCLPAEGFKTVYSCKIPMFFGAAQTGSFDPVFTWLK